MDLTDLWQQHKKFILAVAGALLLLLVGRGVLQGYFPVDEERRKAKSIAEAMRKKPEVPDSMVRDLQSEVDALKARHAELAGAMRFKPGDDFLLPPGESEPRMFFFKRLRELQGPLVDAAAKQDIRVPAGLGLKELTPTDPEEIRRTLLALNVIQDVVVQAIGSGVRRIDTIHIEEAQRGRSKSSGNLKELRLDFDIVGGERSLRSMVAGLVDGAAAGSVPYVAIDKARLKPVKGESSMLELSLSISALEIEKVDGEESR
jgi:hypothetical protein